MTVMEERTRCIVLRPESDAASQRLEAELAMREWTCIEWHDPYEAMADLCLSHRAESSRAAWGLETSEMLALTLPAEHACSAIVDAVRTYLPAVQVWRFDDDGLTLEHAGEPSPTHKSPEAAPDRAPQNDYPSTPAQVASTAPLRLAEASLDAPFPQETEAVDDAPDEETDEASTDVTREELAMLLAFEPPMNEPDS